MTRVTPEQSAAAMIESAQQNIDGLAILAAGTHAAALRVGYAD